ncbi:MAG: hypothetical protein NTX99_05605, partial [Candidatus Aminicenantes bacterium]|nr:hypothetical protein [Candidatus Aminicenantes bacterium]
MNRTRRVILLTAIAILMGGAMFAAAQAPAEKPDLTLTLKIGDPKLKDKVMDLGVGAILAGRTGQPVGFEKMIDEMMPARIVHVGESHNS